MFDLVIRGGTVFDGLGRSGERADVAIRDGVVAEVGRVSHTASRVIEAEGMYVTPGFIDGHTHLDAQIFWDPHGGSLGYHGVTSAVIGNCGFTLAPGRGEDSDLILRSIERSEDMSRQAIEKGVPWTWSTFPEFVTAVDRLPKALNIAVQIGHSALRAAVMGERAFSDRASPAEIETMCRHVQEAVEAGATGFSTSRSPAHLTKSGEPVASRAAPWEEVVQIVSAMGETGAGVFQLAPERPTDPTALSDFQYRLETLAAATRIPVTFMVGGQREQLTTIDRVVANGGTAAGQVHVRGFENIFGFKTQLPFDRLPLWSSIRATPLEDQARSFRDPALHAQLVTEALQGDYGESVGAEVRAPQYDQITVISGTGRDVRLSDIAHAKGITPVEVMIDLALATDFDQLFRQPISDVPDDLVLAGLRHPHTVIAASDSGAHISQILDSNIPTYFLSYWVREREAFEWPEAIRMLTSIPARFWGLEGRGVLRANAHADVVVFDPATVGSGLPKVVADLPDGGPRLSQPSVGIHATVVNGRVVVLDGEPTGDTSGVLLRGSRSRKPR